MNPTIPARVHARNRHDQRLQSMTLGAAALGFVATGAFAYAAALTYSGTTSTVNAAVQQPAGLGEQRVVPNDGGTSGNFNQQPVQPNTQGGTVNPFFGNGQVAPQTTTRHHAISGGS